MNEEIRGKLSKIYCALEVITLCILIFTIIYLNFFKLVNSMDTDYIAEFNYGRNVWETKNIVSDSWICANEYMFFGRHCFMRWYMELRGNTYYQDQLFCPLQWLQ